MKATNLLYASILIPLNLAGMYINVAVTGSLVGFVASFSGLVAGVILLRGARS